jgi:hypothetical protein
MRVSTIELTQLDIRDKILYFYLDGEVVRIGEKMNGLLYKSQL